MTVERVLEVVQSLNNGGRTTRYLDTVDYLNKYGVFVLPICFNTPNSTLNTSHIRVLTKSSGVDLKLIFKLYEAIKKNNINVVHAHCEQSALYAGIAAYFLKIPVITTFHRSDLTKYKLNITNRLVKIFTHHFVCVSNNRLKLLKKNLGILSENCSVVHGGTKPSIEPTQAEIAEIRRELAILQNEIVLLSIGHLGPIKGHQNTIEAIAALKNKYPSIHLYIAGSGSNQEQQNLNQLINQLKVQSYVTFLGQIDNTQQWLKACDIFIQPSIEEAFGLVFIEAGANAKPVVATEIGGIKEIIKNRETGLLVQPNQSKVLANTIEQLINSRALREKLGYNGYIRVNQLFTLEQMIEKYLNIFNKAIESK